MALVTFVNESAPYLNAENLNNNFNELSEALSVGEIVYTGDITSTGSYDFTKNISDYRLLAIELTTGTASNRAYCIILGNKIVGSSSQWLSSYIDGNTIYARVSAYPTYLSVINIGNEGSSSAHIRSVRAFK